MISAQVSLYPLGQKDLAPAVQAAVKILEGLPHRVGAMSTQVWGEEKAVFAALREAFAAAAQQGHAVMSVTISNACPLPGAHEAD
jgi:uncharacterized protein YqgV (UPF0045/DUF77 family)